MYVEYKSRRLPVSWYLSTSPERDLTDAATFTSARRDPGAVESKVCKSPAEFLTPDTWFSLHRCRLRIKTHRIHCSHRRRSTVSRVRDGISSSRRSRLEQMLNFLEKMMRAFGKLALMSIPVAMVPVRCRCYSNACCRSSARKGSAFAQEASGQGVQACLQTCG